MAHLLSLASGAVPETRGAETVAAAAEAELPAVGLWVEPERWTPATSRDVRARCADTGVRVLDVEVVWLGPDTPLDSARRIVDAGAEVGAENVLVVSAHPERQRTVDEFGAVCEHAAARGLRAVLEFMRFTRVRTLDDALDVLKRTDHPAAGLLVDTLHWARCGHTCQALADLEPAWLPYAQLCDGHAAIPDESDAGLIADALDGRASPGEGELDVAGFVRALPDGLPFSLEVRSRPLRERYPEPAARARAIGAATRAFLAGLSR